MSSGPNLTTRLPATGAYLAAPSDTDDLAYTFEDGPDPQPVKCRGVSCKTAGDIAFQDEEGNQFLATGLAAGVVHPISFTRLLATGTTALNITVYW